MLIDTESRVWYQCVFNNFLLDGESFLARDFATTADRVAAVQTGGVSTRQTNTRYLL